jgi:hypothetical protein
VCVFCDVERMAKFVFENDLEVLSKTLNDIRGLERMIKELLSKDAP